MEYVSIITEKYQRNAWDRMKNSINEKISEINENNMYEVSKKLYSTNIYRGRGVLTNTVIEAQEKYVPLTPVYAALFASINMVFPIIGDLLLRRLIWRYQQGHKEDSFELKSYPAIFISFLFHHHVANEGLVRQILIDLLTNPTNRSMQLVVTILSICGAKLDTEHKQALWSLLLEYRNANQFDQHTIFMIDEFLATYGIYNQVDSSKSYEIGKQFQVTHVFQLFLAVDPENYLDEFVYDPNYKVAEVHYLNQINIIFGNNYEEEEKDEIGNKYRSTKISRVRRKLF